MLWFDCGVGSVAREANAEREREQRWCPIESPFAVERTSRRTSTVSAAATRSLMSSTTPSSAIRRPSMALGALRERGVCRTAMARRAVATSR